MALWGFWGDFLHNEPLPSFIDSLLSIFSPYISLPFDFCSLFLGFGSIPPLCWLPFPVAASDLSAPKKCRARFGLDQQNNWCGPCRCVWCVLAPARARWRLGNSMLGLSPLLSAAAFPSSALPFFCLSCQAIVTFQLPPATPCQSISRFLLLNFYLLFGKKGINSKCQSVCMNDVCTYVLIKKHFWGYGGFIAFTLQ